MCPRLLGGPLAIVAVGMFGGCAHPAPRSRAAPVEIGGWSTDPATRREVQVGYASWYGGRLVGRRTASGERYDPRQMTAAHRTLPFGTWVEVRRMDTGASVVVRVTDRGPFGHDDRIIDLSREAARRLGMLGAGLAPVQLRVVGQAVSR